MGNFFARGVARQKIDWGRIGVRHLAVSMLCAALVARLAVPAFADVVTYNISFTAEDLQVGSGPDPAPVDPVIGSFTVMLDPAVAVVGSTANITLNTLNIALDSAISFTYNPNVDGGFAAGTLRVGGAFNGPDVIQFTPSTNDFWLYINDLSGTPTFQQLGYTQTSVSSDNLFFTLNQTGSASVSAVPESSAWALMLTAGGGAALVWVMRKRKSWLLPSLVHWLPMPREPH
jgi:hypothetical protein